MATSEITNTRVSDASTRSEVTSGSVEMSILQVQLLIAEDFNDQVKRIGDQIDQLSKAKDKVRDRLNTLSEFMAMPVDNNIKDQQAGIWVSDQQLADFLGAMKTTDVNLDTLATTDESLMIADRGTDHVFDEMSLEQIWNESAGYAHGELDALPGTKTPTTQQSTVGDGNRTRAMYSPELAQTGGQSVNKPQKDYSGQGLAVKNQGDRSKASDWEAALRSCAEMNDPGIAMAFAKNFPKGDKGGSLPFFYKQGDKKAKDSEGRPVFCLLRSSIEEYKTMVTNNLTKLDEKTEKLTNKLSQLIKLHEKAVNSAMQTIKKEEEMKVNVLNKVGT